MLHKEIPFLRIGLPLCLGIITGLIFHPGNNIVILSLSATIIFLLISKFFNKRINNYFYGIALSFALIIAGNLFYHNEKSSLSVMEQKESFLLCSLTDYPEEKENTWAITVKMLMEYSSKDTLPLNGSLLLYHRKADSLTNILPGDLLIIRCTPVEVTNKGNPSEFDYRFYLENRGIRYYAFTDSSSILKIVAPLKRTLRNHAYMIRKRIVEMFNERGIEGERLALVAAITLGQKSLLDPETKLNFSKAGAMHIMAVSGLNAGILSIFIFNILFFMRGKLGSLRAIITILLIWLFAFVTGFSPSVERATLMFSFLQAGKLIKRQVNGINSVIASAFVMMLIQPSVIFDTGFQLSFVAVLFIIGFYEDFYVKLQFNNKISDMVWQAIVVTLIAQAGTTALTIMCFNRFPVYFLLTNIFVVPISSLMIILACVVLITFPFPFISVLVAKLLNASAFLTEESTRIIASLGYSTIDNIGLTEVQCILITIFIALFLYYILNKESLSIHFPLAFLILVITTGSFLSIKTERTNELIIYNTQGSSTIGIRTGDIMTIYRKDLLIPPEVTRHCAIKGYEIRSDTLNRSVNIIKADTTVILISNNIIVNDSFTRDADIVILTGRYPVYESKVTSPGHPQKIIVTSEAAAGYELPNGSIADEQIIFYVRKSGAGIISL